MHASVRKAVDVSTEDADAALAAVIVAKLGLAPQTARGAPLSDTAARSRFLFVSRSRRR
jgi:hypothetical protein